MNLWWNVFCLLLVLINENFNYIIQSVLDLQERINKHNYLKLVQLITNIARNVLVDVLKRRLPETTLGYSLNGMKNRILPLLNEQERQVLYPDNSYYKGDLSDLDISLMYTILRNLNTICPHTNGWGNMPKDNDKDMSANIERIRIFKNKLVSHHPKCSVDTEEFQQTWTEIRACIIKLGGSEYIKTIDHLLTSEINPLMERELVHTLKRAKEAERLNEVYMNSLKADIDDLKLQLTGITRNCVTSKESSGIVPLKLKIVGEDIPSVEQIEKRTKELKTKYLHIKSIQEGSIIICLNVPSLALHSLGCFFEDVETLLSTILRRKHNTYNGRTSNVIISLEFMDQKNESLVYRKPYSDMAKLMENWFEDQNIKTYVEKMRYIFMRQRQDFSPISHYPTRPLNVDSSIRREQIKHVYDSPYKTRDKTETKQIYNSTVDKSKLPEETIMKMQDPDKTTTKQNYDLTLNNSKLPEEKFMKMQYPDKTTTKQKYDLTLNDSKLPEEKFMKMQYPDEQQTKQTYDSALYKAKRIAEKLLEIQDPDKTTTKQKYDSTVEKSKLPEEVTTKIQDPDKTSTQQTYDSALYKAKRIAEKLLEIQDPDGPATMQEYLSTLEKSALTKEVSPMKQEIDPMAMNLKLQKKVPD